MTTKRPLQLNIDDNPGNRSKSISSKQDELQVRVKGKSRLIEDKLFARERSHQDVKAANDFARAAAQAAVLINGGAATAVFAYSAKIENITSHLIRVVPYSLGGYAVGVLFGAVMMFFMKIEMDHYGHYWKTTALAEVRPAEPIARKAWRYQILANLSFAVSMFLFVISTLAIAISLLRALQ